MQGFMKLSRMWCLTAIVLTSFIFACGGGGGGGTTSSVDGGDTGVDAGVVGGDCAPAGAWTISRTRTSVSGSGTICNTPGLFPTIVLDQEVQATVNGSQMTFTTVGSTDPPVTVNLDANCGAEIQTQTPDQIVTTANGVVVTIKGGETTTFKFSGATVTGTDVVELTSTPAIPELPCTGTYSITGKKH